VLVEQIIDLAYIALCRVVDRDNPILGLSLDYRFEYVREGGIVAKNR
jgi:hypothetical protein